MTSKPHIVVVDDEADVRDTVGEYLGLHGLDVSTAGDGEALDVILAERAADVVILDIRMPGEDGLSIARRLASGSSAGILMLTAAGETVDRIVGLEMGADDYVAKPVDLRHLLARVKALLRRLDKAHTVARKRLDADRKHATFGACTLDLEAHKLFGHDGREIPLTAMEFDLLKAFAEHPNRVLTRDRLLDLAHGRSEEPFDRSIDIRVARLRRKIEQEPSKPQTIRTVRGAGYMYVPPEA